MMPKLNVYLISGMGLDERLFYKLKLNTEQVQYIQWIEPKTKETFEKYCMRLTQQIENRKDVILVGVSFGGMAAIEIAKLIRVKQVIIISSIKTQKERPFYFKIISKIPIYHWTTPNFRKRFRSITGKLFGMVKQEHLDYFDQMFERHSESYKTWAIRKIANWKNDSYPPNLLHIHGTKDAVFPFKKIDRNKVEIIKGGTHNIVVTHAREISEILNKTITA